MEEGIFDCSKSLQRFYPEFLSNIEMFQKIPLLVGYERELWKNIENSLAKQVASLSETILNFINPRNIES